MEGSQRGINNVFLEGIRVCDLRGLDFIGPDRGETQPRPGLCGNEAEAVLNTPYSWMKPSIPFFLCSL